MKFVLRKYVEAESAEAAKVLDSVTPVAECLWNKWEDEPQKNLPAEPSFPYLIDY